MESVSDIRSPFYRGKDPMKEIYWKVKNLNDTQRSFQILFTPDDARIWFDTSEFIEQKGFIQIEVCLYFNEEKL